jgi:hypothetical protein
MNNSHWHVKRIVPAVGAPNFRTGIVYIIDDCNDMGGTSVTNDAEAVVEELLGRWPGYRIIYRDTDEEWCELMHNGKEFTGFGPNLGHQYGN